jgi:hypothetical protein
LGFAGCRFAAFAVMFAVASAFSVAAARPPVVSAARCRKLAKRLRRRFARFGGSAFGNFSARRAGARLARAFVARVLAAGPAHVRTRRFANRYFNAR